MKYKLRAPQLRVWTQDIDSKDYPHVFDERGNLYEGQDLNGIGEELFIWGDENYKEDWEFTNLDKVGG